jgi:hypothetical protein
MTKAHLEVDQVFWNIIVTPLATASDAVARLDERLRASPIREGFVARGHFHDACASLWMDGVLANLEDLVLHDARMDIRTPTVEITRAHAIVRARRRIAAEPAGWSLTTLGIDWLRGRNNERGGRGVGDKADDMVEVDDDREFRPSDPDDPWSIELARMDAALSRTTRALDRSITIAERDPLVYDLDWDEEARLKAWRDVVASTGQWPPVLAAVVALDAWEVIDPLQHLAWLGPLLAADLLRKRDATRFHLMGWNVGSRETPREKRRAQSQTTRLLAKIDALNTAATIGMKNHDRWLLARKQLESRLRGHRSNSKLPALIELVMARPMVSTGMIAKAIGVTPRAVQEMIDALGLRETTGRGRYRAWGVL